MLLPEDAHLRLEPNLPHQLDKSRVGANRIIEGADLNVGQSNVGAFIVGPLQPFQRGVLVIETQIEK